MRSVSKELEKTYSKMELRTGDVLDYCGIDLDFSEKGCVKIVAIEYIKESIEQFAEEVGPTRKPLLQNTFLMYIRNAQN